VYLREGKRIINFAQGGVGGEQTDQGDNVEEGLRTSGKKKKEAPLREGKNPSANRKVSGKSSIRVADGRKKKELGRREYIPLETAKKRKGG